MAFINKQGNTMTFHIKHTGVAVAIGVLVGCGGGGGGGGSAGGGNSVSTAALTSANQTIAAQDVSSTALSLFDSSQLALGAVSTRESALYAEAFLHLDRLPIYMRDAVSNATATGVVGSQSYGCPGPNSGSFLASATDADNSGTVTAGDSISLTFNNCDSGSGILTGSLSFRIDSLSGTYGVVPYNVGVTMAFGNLGLGATAYSASLLGSITIAGAKSGANDFMQSISTTSLSASATYGNVTRSRSLTSFTASESRTADANYTYLSNYNVAGRLTSSGFTGTQAVSFSTPTTIVRRGTDMYPYTGVLLISGASNSALRLTVISNSQVQEDLDANGDGTYEGATIVNWNTLL
jgi:hypothetical protein